jgi:single-strand DNA-binding protein
VPINSVTIVGNLTRDPELRGLPSGGSVCSLRVAVNERRKNGQTGQWDDVPNFFNVTVFGNSADAAAKFLAKGRHVAVDGRLRWREYQDKDGNRREAIEIVAQDVQFIGGRDEQQNGGGLPQATSWGGGDFGASSTPQPAATAPAPSGGYVGDDDIPFAFPVERDHRSHDHNPYAKQI